MATGYSSDADHADSMQNFPKILTSLLGEPMPFSREKHGERVQLSADNSIAKQRESQQSKQGGIAYTEHPIPVNRVWRLILLPNSEQEIVSSGLYLCFNMICYWADHYCIYIILIAYTLLPLIH